MKKLILTTCILSLTFSISQAETSSQQKDNVQKLQIKVKEKADPDFYIDGVQYDSKIFNLLDPDKIQSVSVYKGKEAIEKYNAPNGVILITTKQAAKTDSVRTKQNIKLWGHDTTFHKEPMVIIDDKVSSYQVLSELIPASIKTITVLKEKASIEMYNAPEGVIIVETKKGNN